MVRQTKAGRMGPGLAVNTGRGGGARGGEETGRLPAAHGPDTPALRLITTGARKMAIYASLRRKQHRRRLINANAGSVSSSLQGGGGGVLMSRRCFLSGDHLYTCTRAHRHLYGQLDRSSQSSWYAGPWTQERVSGPKRAGSV